MQVFHFTLSEDSKERLQAVLAELPSGADTAQADAELMGLLPPEALGALRELQRGQGAPVIVGHNFPVSDGHLGKQGASRVLQAIFRFMGSSPLSARGVDAEPLPTLASFPYHTDGSPAGSPLDFLSLYCGKQAHGVSNRFIAADEIVERLQARAGGQKIIDILCQPDCYSIVAGGRIKQLPILSRQGGGWHITHNPAVPPKTEILPAQRALEEAMREMEAAQAYADILSRQGDIVLADNRRVVHNVVLQKQLAPDSLSQRVMYRLHGIRQQSASAIA